jgi:hypothetical protein
MSDTSPPPYEDAVIQSQSQSQSQSPPLEPHPPKEAPKKWVPSQGLGQPWVRSKYVEKPDIQATMRYGK